MAEHSDLAGYKSLSGKSVFVTGGGTGIGEAIVTAFSAQGAKVAFVDIAVEPSLALCDRVAAMGYFKPLFLYCDIRDIDSLQSRMLLLSEEQGDFEILVNNAGNDDRHRPEDVTQEYYDDRVAINQRPMFFTCQFVIKGMRKRGGGSIINIGSNSWHLACGGYPVYASTKAAVSGLTRGLARDLGCYKIRVNTVTPGWVMTARQAGLWAEEAGRRKISENQCLPGRVMPEHVAQMVLFLASDASAMCTAQEFVVDGGWS